MTLSRVEARELRRPDLPYVIRYRDDAGRRIRERFRSVEHALERGGALAGYGLRVWLFHPESRRPVRCVA